MKTSITIVCSLLLLFNGIGALYGGWSFMMHPDGSGLQMSTEWLKHSPFQDYFIPGIILFIANGLFSVLAFVLLVLKKTMAPGFVIIQGSILTGWILIQILFIQTVHPFHLVCALIGLILIGVGFTLRKYRVH